MSETWGEWDAAHRAFLRDPGKWSFLCEWAKRAECLPVYVDWTHALGVTIDGGVLAYEHDPRPGAVPEAYTVTDLRMLNIALVQGMKRYPWLARLLPARPGDAQACSNCADAAARDMMESHGLICYCGGVGWVPASDTWVNRDRLKP